MVLADRSSGELLCRNPHFHRFSVVVHVPLAYDVKCHHLLLQGAALDPRFPRRVVREPALEGTMSKRPRISKRARVGIVNRGRSCLVRCWSRTVPRAERA